MLRAFNEMTVRAWPRKEKRLLVVSCTAGPWARLYARTGAVLAVVRRCHSPLAVGWASPTLLSSGGSCASSPIRRPQWAPIIFFEGVRHKALGIRTEAQVVDFSRTAAK